MLVKRGLPGLPLKSSGYVLNKQFFQDAICLRYDFTIPNKKTLDDYIKSFPETPPTPSYNVPANNNNALGTS